MRADAETTEVTDSTGVIANAASRAPRTSLQLLVDRNFGVLFWGKLVSLVAAWALMIVVIMLTFEVTGSAGWAGAMTAAQLGPQLFLGLLSGRLADSRGPVLQIVVGGVLSGVAALGLAAWMIAMTATDRELTPVPLLLASVAFGCGLAMSAPSMHSIVPRLVRPAELSGAVALNFFPTALARTLGPAGGAVVAALLGPTVCLIVVGAIFLISSLMFCFIRTMRTVAPPRDGEGSVVVALRYVARTPILVVSLFAVAAIGAGSEPAITLAPVLAETVGLGADGAGWVTSFFGAGGLFGVLVHKLLSRWLRPPAEGCVAMIALAAAMAVVGIGAPTAVFAGAMVVGGLSMVLGITAFSVAIQQNCDEVMLGRVMAMWVLAFAGVRPVAGLAQGFVADRVSPVAAVEGTVVLLVVACLLVAVVTVRDRRRPARSGRSARG